MCRTVTLGQSSTQPTGHRPRTQSSSQPKHHHQRTHMESRGFHAGGRWGPVASMHEEDKTQWLPGMLKMEYRGLPELGKHHLLTMLSLDAGFVLEGRHHQGYTLRANELRLKSRKAEESRVSVGSRRLAARKETAPSTVHSEGMTLPAEWLCF